MTVSIFCQMVGNSQQGQQYDFMLSTRGSFLATLYTVRCNGLKHLSQQELSTGQAEGEKVSTVESQKRRKKSYQMGCEQFSKNFERHC